MLALFMYNVSSVYEPTENELQWSGMTISKKSSRVLKVTDFEIIVCPPTSTLKFKLKIGTNYINFYTGLLKIFMAFRPI